MYVRAEHAGNHPDAQVSGRRGITENLITVVPMPGIQWKQRSLLHGIHNFIQFV